MTLRLNACALTTVYSQCIAAVGSFKPRDATGIIQQAIDYRNRANGRLQTSVSKFNHVQIALNGIFTTQTSRCLKRLTGFGVTSDPRPMSDWTSTNADIGSWLHGNALQRHHNDAKEVPRKEGVGVQTAIAFDTVHGIRGVF